MTHGLARQQLKGGVIIHHSFQDHSAVTMIRVFAKAYVGNNDHSGQSLLDGPDGLLHHPVIRPGTAPHRVLAVRQSEKEDRRNTEGPGLCRLPGDPIRRIMELSRERGNRLLQVISMLYEKRIDKVFNRQGGFPDHIPDSRTPPESSRPKYQFPVNWHGPILPYQ